MARINGRRRQTLAMSASTILLMVGCGGGTSGSNSSISNAPAPASAASGIVDLSGWNSSLWTRSDGFGNGQGYDVGWRADHASILGAVLQLSIDNANGTCPTACAGKPYAAGEVQTTSTYGYGMYQVDMQTSNGVGTVSTIFTYVDPTGNGSNDEIDIEIPGARPNTMETTYYRHGGTGIEHTVQLGFDSSQTFHTYAIRWLPTSISWIVDGQVLYTAAGSELTLPTVPSHLLLNFWTGQPSWLGTFSGSAPQPALYKNASFLPLQT